MKEYLEKIGDSIELIKVLEAINENLKHLQGIHEELIRIQEAIKDSGLPKATSINVRRNK